VRPLLIVTLLGAAALAAPVPAPAPAPETYRGTPSADLMRSMQDKPVKKMLKRFSSQWPVYQLELEGGMQVAFRPSSEPYPDLWRFEIASYQLARLLGIAERVPPVGWRTVPRALLEVSPRATLPPAPGAPDQVFGSVTPWLPVLAPTGLSGARGRRKWGRWLDPRRPPPAGDDATRALDMSALVVFDYLHANTDRFDNAPNLRADEHGRLLLRDNTDTWTVGRMKNLALNGAELRAAQRFSRALVAALRQSDRAALAATLDAIRPYGRALLTRRQLDLYERRRKHVLKHIDTSIKRHGEAAVMPWP